MQGVFWDCIAFIGASSVCAGIAFIHWPSAIIVAGVFLLALSIMGARVEKQEQAAEPEKAPAIHQEDD